MKDRKIFILFFLAALLVLVGLVGCNQIIEPTYESAIEAVASDYLVNPPRYIDDEDDTNNYEYADPDIDPTRWSNEELSLFIDNLLTKGDMFIPENGFWGTTLVMRGDDIIIYKAYGLACAEQNIANTLDTPFDIASITKQITGAAIIQLVADGSLRPDDTLDMFFPAHDGLANVTVTHLLAMRGGFGNYIYNLSPILSSEENSLLLFQELIDSLPEEDALLVLDRLQAKPDDNLLEVLWKFQELESIHTFIMNFIENLILTNWNGETLNYFSYSNSDYWLLGRIIEQASGMTYKEFITTRIFEPIGMQNSGFNNLSNQAIGHDTNRNTLGRVPFAMGYSSGGLTSTVGDLNLWLDAYFGGKLFPEVMLEQVFVGNYNCGWMFINESIWWHGGSRAGFLHNMLVYDRDNDIRMIILSNQGNRQTQRIYHEISSRVFNRMIF